MSILNYFPIKELLSWLHTTISKYPNKVWQRGHCSYFENPQKIEATVEYEVAQTADQVFEIYLAQSEFIEMQQAQNQLKNYSVISSKLSHGICADSAKGIGCGPEPISCIGRYGGCLLYTSDAADE